MQAQYSFDVAIVGAGIIGLTLALALENNALRVVIIEAHDKKPRWDAENVAIRVSAITRGSQMIFKKLGVWDAIAQMRISPFREIFVEDAATGANIHFDSADVGESDLGHIIENSVIETALWQKLSASPSVKFIMPARLQQIEQHEDIIKLQLDNQQTISAKLAVGADGAQSQLRQLAQFDLTEREYGHSALIATIQTAMPHQEIARQRFLTTGPLAFLPLSSPNQCSIVWSTFPDEAQRLAQLEPEDFKKDLAEAFAYQLGTIKDVAHRTVLPLKMRHAKNYVKPRLALVGDAAHTLHPLAGQGMNLGLLDAVTLADVILNAAIKQRDIGSFATLRRYERYRKGHNLEMIALMDGFKNLFATSNPVIKYARQVGLTTVGKVQPLKNFIMRRAMAIHFKT